jgi:uncharacterized damage-inducible protein DinB
MELLTGELAAKVREQIERSVHLISFVPEDNLEWTPPIAGAWSFDQLLGHLLDCMAGFCAVLYTAHPGRLAHFTSLQSLPVNQTCPPAEAVERIRRYQSHVDEGFAVLSDADLARRLATVFVPDGETVLTLLLGNLEHLINHKHQLFMYLKLAGIDVRTPDLYQFR